MVSARKNFPEQNSKCIDFEIQLQEALSQSESRPAQQLTYRCFAILETMIKSKCFGPYTDVVRRIAAELDTSIYSPDLTFGATDSRALLERVPYFVHVHRIQAELFEEISKREKLEGDVEELSSNLKTAEDLVFSLRKENEELSTRASELDERSKYMQELVTQNRDKGKETQADYKTNIHHLTNHIEVLNQKIERIGAERDKLKEFKANHDALKRAFLDLQRQSGRASVVRENGFPDAESSMKAAAQRQAARTDLEEAVVLERQLVLLENSRITEFEHAITAVTPEGAERLQEVFLIEMRGLEEELRYIRQHIDTLVARQQAQGAGNKVEDPRPKKILVNMDSHIDLSATLGDEIATDTRARANANDFSRGIPGLSGAGADSARGHQGNSKVDGEWGEGAGGSAHMLSGETVLAAGRAGTKRCRCRCHKAMFTTALEVSKDAGSTFVFLNLVHTHDTAFRSKTVTLPPMCTHVRLVRAGWDAKAPSAASFLPEVGEKTVQDDTTEDTKNAHKAAVDAAVKQHTRGMAMMGAMEPAARADYTEFQVIADHNANKGLLWEGYYKRGGNELAAKAQKTRCVTPSYLLRLIMQVFREKSRHDDALSIHTVPPALEEFFYSYLDRKYVLKEVVLKVAYSAVKAMETFYNTTPIIRLFYESFLGETSEGAWRYILRMRDVLASLPTDLKPVATIDQFEMFCRIIYPDITYEALKELVRDFVDYVHSSGSQQLDQDDTAVFGADDASGRRAAKGAMRHGIALGQKEALEGGGSVVESVEGATAEQPTVPPFGNTTVLNWLTVHVLRKKEYRIQRWQKIIKWKSGHKAGSIAPSDLRDLITGVNAKRLDFSGAVGPADPTTHASKHLRASKLGQDTGEINDGQKVLLNHLYYHLSHHSPAAPMLDALSEIVACVDFMSTKVQLPTEALRKQNEISYSQTVHTTHPEPLVPKAP